MIEFITILNNNNINVQLKGEELEVSFDEEEIDVTLLQEIKDKKSELIDYFKKYVNQSEYQKITPAKKQQSYSLSNAQKRLWIISQMEGGSVAHNLPDFIQFDGNFDIQSFEQAIDNLIERHEILRTVFRKNENNEVRQWILSKEELGFKVKYKDVREEKNIKEFIGAYRDIESNRPFDLENGPLFSATVFHISDDFFALYYNMHHIISDGWSLEVLIKDIMTFYESNKSNLKIELPKLKMHYKDFSHWQNEKLKNGEYREHEQFWKNQFSGTLPVLNLSSGTVRPRVKNYDGHHLLTFISPDITSTLRTFCKNQGGSIFTGILATWNILLHKYTNESDFIIGTPTACRDQADLDDQIGLYVNSLALRNTVGTNESFVTLYNRIKQTTLAAFKYQTYPFDKLVEDLDLVRDSSRNPLFDIMLTFHNVGKSTNENIQINKDRYGKIEDRGSARAKFDLEIDLKEMGGGLSLSIRYNTHIYKKDMIERFMTHFNQLLQNLLENPQEKIEDIDYLNRDEIDFLSKKINHGVQNKDYLQKNYIDLFYEKANDCPNDLALIFEDREFSYGDLNKASNQLARYLYENNSIETEDLIGIQLERSPWMVISILAIMKTGAAYFPIDIACPQKRKNYIIGDSNCKLVIDGDLIKDFTINENQYSDQDLEIDIIPQQLAYMIYTSGSTGEPKGVLVEHQNLMSFLDNLNGTIDLQGIGTFAATSNYTFDVTLIELLGLLIQGVTVDLFSDKVLNDPYLIAERIKNKKIDGLQLTPSRCTQILVVSDDFLDNVKLLLIGAQVINKKLHKKLALLKTKTIHLYGTTETTVWDTSMILNDSETLHIGKPLDNEHILVLDSQQNVVPIYVIGEICIGGGGVTRGYLNQYELTKEKFIEHPFKPGERLYRTGDLGRWLPNKNLELIGRMDNQVKIRGHRIELKEIEKQFLLKEEIEDVVVLVKEEKEELNLVAYIVSSKEQNTSDLRAHLAKTLPKYMLPSYYIQLNEIPLTKNGKIDKIKLLNTDGIFLSGKSQYVAPGNEIEVDVVSIWEKVLNRENISVTDSFFHIGGDSIKGIRIISEIKKRYAADINTTTLFNNPNVKSLAEEIANQIWIKQHVEENEIVDKITI